MPSSWACLPAGPRAAWGEPSCRGGQTRMGRALPVYPAGDPDGQVGLGPWIPTHLGELTATSSLALPPMSVSLTLCCLPISPCSLTVCHCLSLSMSLCHPCCLCLFLSFCLFPFFCLLPLSFFPLLSPSLSPSLPLAHFLSLSSCYLIGC